MRTYGSIHMAGEFWNIDAEAHVVIRLKRLFGKLGKSAKRLSIRHTPDVARDLTWVMERYPLAISDGDRKMLDQATALHIKRSERFVRLLSGADAPRAFALKLPAREYQLVAADLALQQGGLLIADEVGLGKAQPLDAKVLTPNGWASIGGLRVGDPVIDPDGGHAFVTGVFHRGVRDVYRVVTSDGASAECCAEHLWGLYTANDRFRGGKLRVHALQDFMGSLKRSHAKESWRISNWFLPIMLPADYTPGLARQHGRASRASSGPDGHRWRLHQRRRLHLQHIVAAVA